MNRWFGADYHLGHKKIIEFVDANGNKTRPFDSVQQHDECIIENHNSCVKEGDKFYSLGDMFFGKENVEKYWTELNGKKERLILGNHDQAADYDLLDWYKDIHLWFMFDAYDFFLSHVPELPSMFRKNFNIHGHTHGKTFIGQTRYHYCISLEMTNMKPVHLDTILQYMRIVNENRDIE